MRPWKVWTLWAVAALAIVAATSGAQQNNPNPRYTLFAVAVFDSNEHASPWIPIKGANRVVIRTWSPYAVTAADSLTTDSLATFDVLFSDSAGSVVRDSSGTLVTLGSYTSVANRATAFPLCVDSVKVVGATATNVDTSKKMVTVASPPLQESLRSTVTGSGIYTYVFPTTPGTAAYSGDVSFTPRFMRIRCTPVRRPAIGGSLMTTPNRVNGIKNFRMEAEVITNRK